MEDKELSHCIFQSGKDYAIRYIIKPFFLSAFETIFQFEKGPFLVGVIVVEGAPVISFFPAFSRDLLLPADAVVAEPVPHITALFAEIGLAFRALVDIDDLHTTYLACGHFYPRCQTVTLIQLINLLSYGRPLQKAGF